MEEYLATRSSIVVTGTAWPGPTQRRGERGTAGHRLARQPAREIDVLADPPAPGHRTGRGRAWGRRRCGRVAGGICRERAEREEHGVELQVEAQAQQVRRTLFDVRALATALQEVENGKGKWTRHGHPPKARDAADCNRAG